VPVVELPAREGDFDPLSPLERRLLCGSIGASGVKMQGGCSAVEGA
jgi:hypothetical protein